MTDRKKKGDFHKTGNDNQEGNKKQDNSATPTAATTIRTTVTAATADGRSVARQATMRTGTLLAAGVFDSSSWYQSGMSGFISG